MTTTSDDGFEYFRHRLNKIEGYVNALPLLTLTNLILNIIILFILL